MLRMPAFGEKAEELLLSSTRVIPGKLMDAGYRFRRSELEEAFRYFFLKGGH